VLLLGGHVPGYEHGQLPQQLERPLGREIDRLDGGVRPPPEVTPVPLVDTEQFGDHDEREGRTDVLDEVDLLLGVDRFEHPHGGAPDRLGHARQGPGGEPAVEGAPEGGVLRRVHVEDGAGPGRHGVAPQRVIDQGALPRAEALGVATQVPDVLVAGHRPVPGRVLEHGILGPERGQDLVIVVAQEEGGVTRVDLRGRHWAPSVSCGPGAVTRPVAAVAALLGGPTGQK
jgi:hypothetical protein